MKKIIFSLLLVGLTINFVAAQNGYKIGDTATDFSLKGTDGKMYSLANYGDTKAFVVIFTCNHCPFSVAYEDRIIELQNVYGRKGIQVIAINPNDPELYESDNFENMVIRANEKKFNFPYLMDEGQKVYPQYGATKTPHVYILDAKKQVQYIGSIDNSTEESEVTETYVADALNALLQGEKIVVTETKAIGCSIKAKKKKKKSDGPWNGPF